MPPQAVTSKVFSAKSGTMAANRSASLVSELSQSVEFREAMDWFRQERLWINDQHLSLCRVPAATFLEAKRAAWMQERFTSLGWESRLDRAGNVIASRPNAAGRPTIAVTAHLDTVLAPRLPEEISVGLEGQFLGPGVSDNGAGLAALLAVAGAWNAVEPFAEAFDAAPFTPVLIANVGEEGEGNLSGMRYLCRSDAKGDIGRIPAGFLVLDGPGYEHITCRALASRRFEVSIEGPGGHSWSDHGTGNPVHALGRTVTLFTDGIAELTPVSALRSSYNFGLIQGGSSINSIPVGAWAKVDLRSEDRIRMNAMAALLQESLERAVA
ncbi:MAG: M28 family peptidase, partial [Acidobacteriota bacterium]